MPDLLRKNVHVENTCPNATHDALRRLLRSGIEMKHFDKMTVSPGFQTPLASARYHRLVCVMTGQLHYRMPGGEMLLSAGYWFYVPPWRKRQWIATGEADLQLAFGTFALEPDLPLLPALAFARDDGLSRRQKFLSFLKPEDQRSSELQLRAEAFLKETFTWIFLDGHLLQEQETSESFSHESLPFRSPASDEIIEACQWLLNNLHKPETLRRLSSSTALSPGYLRMKFKEETGVTPREYLQELRMHKAHAMMFLGKYTVKETAFACGFTDPLYFSRTYRKFWGVPPSSVEQTLG